MCSLWLQGWSGASESGRPNHPVSRDNSWRIEVSPSRDLLTTCFMSWHQSAAQTPPDEMAVPGLQTSSMPLSLCDCWDFSSQPIWSIWQASVDLGLLCSRS